MSTVKTREAAGFRDFLFIEEATSDEGEGRRIKFSASQTVQALKQTIAVELQIPKEWNDLTLTSSGQDLQHLDRSHSSYGVYDGDTVFYFRDGPTTQPPPYTPAVSADDGGVFKNIMFRDLDGKTLNLQGINKSATVKQMRVKLGEGKHLSDKVDKYRFI